MSCGEILFERCALRALISMGYAGMDDISLAGLYQEKYCEDERVLDLARILMMGGVFSRRVFLWALRFICGKHYNLRNMFQKWMIYHN